MADLDIRFLGEFFGFLWTGWGEDLGLGELGG
jgi:hypothetical protein